MIIRRVPGGPLKGRLTYVRDEHSFRFDVDFSADLLERAGGSELASVSIGTLQIEVGVATRRALFAWGLHPRSRWLEAEIPSPRWLEGAAILGPATEYSAGASVKLSDVGEWGTAYDADTGWVRVSADPAAEDEIVEIASGVLLGSRGNELSSVWLRPNFQ